MTPNIGIDNDKLSTITDGLSRLLADSYSLYVKTHNFHWNVTGPMFVSLHTLFETQYTELSPAIDEIAERIRTLGARAPGSFSEFLALTRIPESTGDLSAHEMVRQLAEANEAVAHTGRELLPFIKDAHDDPTEDLVISRIRTHEKAAWMLRSMMG